MSWLGPVSGPRIRRSPTRQSIAFCERVQQVAQRIDPVPALFALPRDPDDEPYLNLAIAAGADYLVTRDNDMLDLMQDATFLAQHPTLTILDPVAMLHFLKPTTPLQP